MNWLWSFVVDKIKDYLVKNWKTTIVGVVGAICLQIPALAPFKEQIVAFVVLLLGILAKDGDQTGTTAQPAPAPAPVEPPSGG
jgi:hypothetical protein